MRGGGGHGVCRRADGMRHRRSRWSRLRAVIDVHVGRHLFMTTAHLNGAASRVAAQQRATEAAVAGIAGEACGGLGVRRTSQWGSLMCC
jgi:hypothetical protein